MVNATTTARTLLRRWLGRQVDGAFGESQLPLGRTQEVESVPGGDGHS